jgi:hypothetical protein
MNAMAISGALLGAALLAGPAVALPSESPFRYQYNLADLTGPIPFLGVHVRLDVPHDEVYTIQANFVQVFGSTDMEIHAFALDPAIGTFTDLAVDEKGDIYVLGYKAEGVLENRGFFLLRCNYRGEPVAEIVPSGVPEGFESFGPNRLVYASGRFFLVGSASLKALIVDRSGAVQQALDLAELAALEPEIRAEAQIGGFDLDPQGRMVFSIPIDFSVRIVSTDGTVKIRFGESGSKKGQFGVVGAVTTDDEGNIYVADKLRSVVIVFDKDQKFLNELGGWGLEPGKFVIPTDVAVTPSGKLFVSQMRNRGVAVFTRTGQEG